MPQTTDDQVTCPQCGTTSDTIVWEGLNSITDKLEVDRLLEGSLFMHECPDCHARIELTYPCVYNDMRAGVMVQYIADEDKLDEAIAEVEKMKAADAEVEGAPTEKIRIVTTHNALREKVLILQDGLDDMVIEALKAVMKNRFIDEGQISGEAEVFYAGLTELGDVLLEFLADGRTAQTMAPRALYDKVAHMVEASPYAQKGAYLVDAIWAELFFKNQACM